MSPTGGNKKFTLAVRSGDISPFGGEVVLFEGSEKHKTSERRNIGSLRDNWTGETREMFS